MRALMSLVLFACAAGKPTAHSTAADPPAVECASDADCALTWVAEGQCCPMLCSPRVVTAKRAAELKEKSADCGRPCPMPPCAPPRQRTVAACVESRCVGRAVKAAEE
jgi:hypothetical protein